MAPAACSSRPVGPTALPLDALLPSGGAPPGRACHGASGQGWLRDVMPRLPASGVVASLIAHWFPPLMCDLRALDLHVATEYALSLCHGSSGPVSQVVVAVDGTGGHRKGEDAAWSFNALAQHADGATTFLGVAGARVQVDGAAKDYLGAQRGTNGTAELSALIWALLWAIQQSYARVVEVQFDAFYSAKVSQAFFHAKTNTVLVDFARFVCDLAAECLDLRWVHTPSHDGHPWNELADSGANAAAKLRFRTPVELPGCIPRPGTAGLSWFFLHFLSVDQRAQYHPHVT